MVMLRPGVSIIGVRSIDAAMGRAIPSVKGRRIERAHEAVAS
jgi:hypothetical protein